MNDSLLVMVAVAALCAVPGVFLVLRKMVLIGDAMSHVLLLGIVLAYFVTNDPSSPLLFFGATAIGVATVTAVEALQRTKLLKEDAAIGLVFPALFSLGTILATMYIRNVHLDIDRVLLGSAELAYLDQVVLAGYPLGPRGFVVPSLVFTLNIAFIVLFYKVLKLATFDPNLAGLLGFSPVWIHYAMMVNVSLTTVTAFDAVGPVLVLAFFAVPAATARLLTCRLSSMLALSVAIAVASAALGTWLANRFDITIAGTVVSVLGLVFLITFLIAPDRGWIATYRRHRRLIRELHESLLVVHLLRHEGTVNEIDESRKDGLFRHMNWTETKTHEVVRRALELKLIQSNGDCWTLTELGRSRARITEEL